MRFTAAAALLAALAASPVASALGINCRGSSNCGFWPSDTMRAIQNYMGSIPDGTTFTNGQQIKCYGNVDLSLTLVFDDQCRANLLAPSSTERFGGDHSSRRMLIPDAISRYAPSSKTPMDPRTSTTFNCNG